MPPIGGAKCRHCGSRDVRLSRISGGKSLLLVYRCRACNHHFKAGLNLRLALAYLSAFVVLVLVLFMLATILYHSLADFELQGLGLLPRQQD
ncbi:MAG: hypothetical protein AB1831_01280 [Pseudomonadota bacterium]